MSLWIKTGERLIDADKAFLIDYAPADAAAAAGLTLRFPDADPSSILLEGADAEAAWKAIHKVWEQRGELSDMKHFQQG